MTDQREPLLYAVSGAVARLTLNRPGKRNALNAALVGALSGALERAERDASVKVVEITGAGADFCAGADLSELRDLAASSVEANLADVDALASVFLQIRTLGKPVVAVVQGRALAGGCGLATACDLVVAARSATFGYPEVHIGFVPAMVMAILRRNVSEKRAFELITLGETFAAPQAERLGLVNRVFDDESFAEDAAAFSTALAERSGTAILLAKRLLYEQDSMGFEAAIRAGADVNVLARMTDDARAGVARFLNRRDS
ncbi:MAG: enoyl-CoA hydratase-related protein [Gemmatimonadota bacterium]